MWLFDKILWGYDRVDCIAFFGEGYEGCQLTHIFGTFQESTAAICFLIEDKRSWAVREDSSTTLRHLRDIGERIQKMGSKGGLSR